MTEGKRIPSSIVVVSDHRPTVHRRWELTVDDRYEMIDLTPPPVSTYYHVAKQYHSSLLSGSKLPKSSVGQVQRLPKTIPRHVAVMWISFWVFPQCFDRSSMSDVAPKNILTRARRTTITVSTRIRVG